MGSGSFSLTPGLSCFHVCFLPVLSCVHLGLPMSPHGLTGPDLLLFASDTGKMGFPLLLRHLCQPDSFIVVTSNMRTGASLSVLDGAFFGLLLLVRTFAKVGVFLAAFDLGSLASPLLLQQVHRIGFLTPSCASQCVGLILFAFMQGHLGPTFPLKSVSWLDIFSSTFGVACFNSSPPLQSCARLGPVLLSGSISRVDILSVLAFLQLGFLLLLQNVARPGPPMPVVSVEALGMLLPLQKSCRCDSTILAFGVVHMELVVSAMSCIQMGFLLFLRSFV